MWHTLFTIHHNESIHLNKQIQNVQNEIRSKICIQLILLFVKYRMIIFKVMTHLNNIVRWLRNYVLFEAKYLHQRKFENVLCAHNNNNNRFNFNRNLALQLLLIIPTRNLLCAQFWCGDAIQINACLTVGQSMPKISWRLSH